MPEITNAELFVQAQEEGFVTDLEDASECNSECQNCPASPACEELSMDSNGESNYSVFVANYKELLPEIRELL